jgi:hypothetical protein
MKLVWFSIGFLVLAFTSGCVQSHRGREVVYYTPPAPADTAPEPAYAPVVTVPPPTSDRPRVYTVPADEVAPPSPPPPGVSNQDLALAESISKLLKNDAHMASISGNVQTTIDQGVVILRGTVPSENAMDEIASRISKLPGVHHIEDHLAVSNR